MPLDHRLDRTITIHAPRETIFRYFTETPQWASWWGAGSTIEARPGGRVYIRYPNGVEVLGEVVDIAPPDRIVFTYGFTSGTPIPPGTSRVTITLESRATDTQLHLAHEFESAEVRDHHVQGWRYQLAVFANVVSDALYANLAPLVDAWFDAWAEPDDDARMALLRRIADPDVEFRDRFSCTRGIDDLVPHIAAAQRFMPGLRLRRVGDPRHCQGLALVEWVASGETGEERARGTNVFALSTEGQLRSVTGFWSARPA